MILLPKYQTGGGLDDLRWRLWLAMQHQRKYAYNGEDVLSEPQPWDNVMDNSYKKATQIMQDARDYPEDWLEFKNQRKAQLKQAQRLEQLEGAYNRLGFTEGQHYVFGPSPDIYVEGHLPDRYVKGSINGKQYTDPYYPRPEGDVPEHYKDLVDPDIWGQVASQVVQKMLPSIKHRLSPLKAKPIPNSPVPSQLLPTQSYPEPAWGSGAIATRRYVLNNIGAPDVGYVKLKETPFRRTDPEHPGNRRYIYDRLEDRYIQPEDVGEYGLTLKYKGIRPILEGGERVIDLGDGRYKSREEWLQRSRKSPQVPINFLLPLKNKDD